MSRFGDKPIQFPDVVTFGALFPSVRPWRSDIGRKPRPLAPGEEPNHAPRMAHGGTFPVGPYLTVRGGDVLAAHGSASVGCSDEVLARMDVRCIFPDRDSMFFELVERGDRTILVSVNHNLIIGSLWLAVLPDASSVPAWLKKGASE